MVSDTAADNAAADILMTQIDAFQGPIIVTEDMQALGLENTFMAGFFCNPTNPCPLLKRYTTPSNQRTDVFTNPDDYNQTTSSDIGMLLTDIYQCSETGGGALIAAFPNKITQADCQLMIEYMEKDKFGSVIPFNPNRILEGNEEAVIAWLKRDYITIKNTLNEIEDKAEFEVQVFMARDVLIDRIKCESDEFMRLKESNSGKAYVLGQRVLRAELEQKVDSVCKSVYAQISKCAAKIKINEITGTLMPEKQPIMSLSCLIHDDKLDELKGVLKLVDDLDGFEVRLSGPWQPYNFILI